jgi:hypothetical protein
VRAIAANVEWSLAEMLSNHVVGRPTKQRVCCGGELGPCTMGV